MQNILLLRRSQLIDMTIQNLVEAQVAKPEEIPQLRKNLLLLDPKDLLSVMLESTIFLAEAPEPIHYLPIREESIGKN